MDFSINLYYTYNNIYIKSIFSAHNHRATADERSERNTV